MTSEPTTNDRTGQENSSAGTKRLRAIAVAIQLLATAIALAVLKRTPDARLRGPRWVWQVVAPLTVTRMTDGVAIIAPLGPILFFLVGRRRAGSQSTAPSRVVAG